MHTKLLPEERGVVFQFFFTLPLFGCKNFISPPPFFVHEYIMLDGRVLRKREIFILFQSTLFILIDFDDLDRTVAKPRGQQARIGMPVDRFRGDPAAREY